MPHKHNADRRHHIPKMAFQVQNWPAYEAGLRRRGSLTLWIEEAALACWQTLGPTGQARYTAAAIQTCLMLRTAFKLALRQAEGLMTSVLRLMGLTLSVPDHTTVSRRAVTLPVIQPASVPHGPLHVLIDSTGLQVYGAGQWLEAKHGAKSRRTWRKLHLAVDAASGMIVAQTLTDQDADDPSQVGPLLDQIDNPIDQVTADGAYDGNPTYQTIAQHGDDIAVVIPPRSTAVPSGEEGSPTQRDRHLATIAEQGRLAWQVSTGYGQRSLVERACKVVGFVPGSVGYGFTERGWLVAKLVWRVKLVAEFDAGETTELEVARIERDGQPGLAGLGLRLAEAKQLTAAIQAEIVPAQVMIAGECRRTCVVCGHVLASKGHYTATFRSLFGDVPIRVQRLLACPCQDIGRSKKLRRLRPRGRDRGARTGLCDSAICRVGAVWQGGSEVVPGIWTRV